MGRSWVIATGRNRWEARLLQAFTNLVPSSQAVVIGLSSATNPSHIEFMTETTQNPILSRLPLIAVIVAGAFALFFLRDLLTFETLSENRARLLEFRDNNYALAVALFILAYFLIVAFSVPGAVVATLTGGFLFGTFPGALYNVTGATLGALAIFMAAKMGLGDRLAARIEGSQGMVKRFKDGFDDNQWSVLFMMRLVPVIPFFLANLIPALVGVSLSRFAITTFFGILPGSVVYTSVGAGLGETFDRGETPDLGILFEPHILLPILGFAALAALPMILKAIRGQKGAH